MNSKIEKIMCPKRGWKVTKEFTCRKCEHPCEPIESQPEQKEDWEEEFCWKFTKNIPLGNRKDVHQFTSVYPWVVIKFIKALLSQQKEEKRDDMFTPEVCEYIESLKLSWKNELKKEVEKLKITEKKGLMEMIFGDSKKSNIRLHTNMDVGYNQAIDDILSLIDSL